MEPDSRSMGSPASCNLQGHRALPIADDLMAVENISALVKAPRGSKRKTTQTTRKRRKCNATSFAVGSKDVLALEDLCHFMCGLTNI